MKVAFVALVALAMASGAAAQDCSMFQTIAFSFTSVAAGGDCLWNLGADAQALKLCAPGTQPSGSYFGPTCTCQATAAQGEACDADTPCAPMDGVFATGLQCVDATCQLQQRWIGDSCNANTDCAHYSADVANGVTCANNVCTTTAAVGDDCSTGLVVCPANSECHTADSATTCTALLASGGDCSTGLSCVPGTAELQGADNACTCTNKYSLANGAAAGGNSDLCTSMYTGDDGNCAARPGPDGTGAVGSACVDGDECASNTCQCTGSGAGACFAAPPAGPSPLAPAQALAACMRTSGCYADTAALEGTCGNMACTSESTAKQCNSMMQVGGDNFIPMLNELYDAGIPSQVPAECDGAAQVVASLMAMVAVAVAALRNL